MTTRFRKLPDTPIEWLASRVKEYLHMPDPMPLYSLIGGVAANMIEGNPLWLMYVGAPGSGKSELLRSVLGLKNVMPADSIESKGSFLSGVSSKEHTANATGGMLKHVGKHGALIIEDFTGVLSLNADQVKAVTDVLRQIYGGKWDRTVGTDGGRTLHWDGKLALFAGVTGEIDRHHKISACLGERWLYYRMDETDGYEKARRALINVGRGNWQEEIRNLVAGFFATIDLEFGRLAPTRAFTNAEISRLLRLASITAKCRSAVPRDSYRANEIISARETEQEGRIAAALGQFLVGLNAVGVQESDRWRIICKVALDSMPRMRQIVVQNVAAAEEITMEKVITAIGCTKNTAERVVDDLAIHGVVEKTHEGKSTSVRLTTLMANEFKLGFNSNGYHPKKNKDSC